MNPWTWLRDRVLYKRFLDSEFGMLTFEHIRTLELVRREDVNTEQYSFEKSLPPQYFGYWRATTTFAPCGKPIQLSFRDDAAVGPTALQRRLYHQLERNWSEFEKPLTQRVSELILRSIEPTSTQLNGVTTEASLFSWVELESIMVAGTIPTWFSTYMIFRVLPNVGGPSVTSICDHELVAYLSDNRIVTVRWEG